jgi:hypothetical protein
MTSWDGPPVEIRPAAIGWRARPCEAWHRNDVDDRSHWRPTKRWAVRAAARRMPSEPEDQLDEREPDDE